MKNVQEIISQVVLSEVESLDDLDPFHDISMPKQKSSATSATRKKHARKAAAGHNEESSGNPPSKGKGAQNSGGKGKGKKKNEPRVKMYIPPVKPQALQRDPIDVLGLASSLPPDLLVNVFRKLTKKDIITRQRALEEFKVNWVDKCKDGGDDDGSSLAVLEIAQPAWNYHFPALTLNPSRRIRLQAATIQATLLDIPSLQESALESSGHSPDQEYYVGAWMLSGFDADRQVASTARQTWTKFVEYQSNHAKDAFNAFVEEHLVSFIQTAIMHPESVYNHFYPVVAKQEVTSEKTRDLASASAIDGEEESQSDRNGRIRVSALGALSWLLESGIGKFDGLNALLADVMFWSILYPGTRPPFFEESMVDVEALGVNQTAVRRAGWSLVQTLAKTRMGASVMCAAVLRSIWIEPDAGVRIAARDGLLLLLSVMPDAWNAAIEDDSESEDESEPDEPNVAYQEFLQFLRLGCGGTCVQFYPAIPVIISKLPHPLFPLSQLAAEELLDAFWVALDGRALTVLEKGNAPVSAFVSAVCETIIILMKRFDRDNLVELSEVFAREQVDRLWDSFISNKLQLRSEDFGHSVGKMLSRLRGIKPDLYLTTWEGIQKSTLTIFSNEELSAASKVDFPGLWKSLGSELPDEKELDSLLGNLLSQSLSFILRPQGQTPRIHLENVLFLLKRESKDGPIKQRLLELLCDNLAPISKKLSPSELSQFISAALEYLKGDAEQQSSLWANFLDIVLQMDDFGRQTDVLQSVLSTSQGVQAPFTLERGLGPVFKYRMENVENPEDPILFGLVDKHELFLTTKDLQTCAQSACTLVTETSNAVLRGKEHVSEERILQSLRLFESISKALPDVAAELLMTLAAPLYVLDYILPLVTEESSTVDSIVDVCERILDTFRVESTKVMIPEFQNWVLNTEVVVGIEDLMTAAMYIANHDATWIVNNLLPSTSTLDAMFLEDIAYSPHPIIAATDNLVPEEESSPGSSKATISTYTRVAWGLAIAAISDRQLAKHNTWVLKHMLLLQQLAEDRLLTSGAGGPDTFGKDVSDDSIRTLINTVQKVTAYLFSGISSTDISHAAVVETLKTDNPIADPILAVIVELCRIGMRQDGVMVARLVRGVLAQLLRGASKADADTWITFARTARRTAPYTAEAIFNAVVSTGVETPLLNRLRNEAASDLIGISSSKANTEGARQLRLLLLLAPPLDSDAVFLPTQRAINLVQAIEKWITSDESDDDDEGVDPIVESRTLALFQQLAPILQSLSGRHWEFAFDVVESTLEDASLSDLDMFVQISRALDLIIVIQGLVVTNKQLKATWLGRRVAILKLVRTLLVSTESHQLSSALSLLYRNRAVAILQESADDVLEAHDFGKMIYLLRAPHLETQRDAYSLVRSAAFKYTEELIMEVGLNTSATEMEIQLPQELIALLRLDDLDVTGYLLSWMAVFDAFENTSLRVRAGYVEHLRNEELITKSFIPLVCRLLDIGASGRKPRKLDLWEVDVFYVSLYEPENLHVLAAHAYYRALQAIPSLIRTWWMDCKDRQLSTAFATFTSTYFSPVLISAELDTVRQSAAAALDENRAGKSKRAQLEDENVSIKVASAIGEVGLVYTIDEQKMEMAVRLPAEYPLKSVEVRDVKRVGVAENKWRGWLFAVQQIVGAQNGHIADALEVFKKNVSLHFEGQVECAICYSIISVTDLQLPTKPCKTCKNRFHASCLYKWFKSSSSSSCPLCRSDIF